MSFVENKNKNQILNELIGIAEPGSVVHEQQKMAIIVRCTEDLEKIIGNLKDSINNNAASNDKLGRKVFWLNLILVITTIIYTIIDVLDYLN